MFGFRKFYQSLRQVHVYKRLFEQKAFVSSSAVLSFKLGICFIGLQKKNVSCDPNPVVLK